MVGSSGCHEIDNGGASLLLTCCITFLHVIGAARDDLQQQQHLTWKYFRHVHLK